MKSFKRYLLESLSGEVVTVNTSDGFELKGILHRGSTNKIIAHTHGTASFYGNEAFEPELLKHCKENGYAFLSFNNRGAHILSENSGAAVELFSDCPKDFDAWIQFCQNEGYEDIVLSGHSLGTEKIAHYVRNFRPSLVSSVILLAPSDTIGNQIRYEKTIGKNFFDESKNLIATGKGNDLLSDKKAHAGVLPMSAYAYIDFYTPGKPLENALSFRKNKLLPLNVSGIAFIPMHDHYNITSPEQYQQCMNAIGIETVMCDTDHDFNGFKNLYFINN